VVTVVLDYMLFCLQTFSIQKREKHANHSCNKFFIHAARNDHHITYDDGLPEEPFLLSLIKDVIWYLLKF